MVLSMKTISLAFDLDSSTVSSLPMPWEYAGYALQVGTVVFGPWVSYHEYANVQLQRERKLVSLSSGCGSIHHWVCAIVA